MNITLLWLLLVPVVLSGITFAIFRKLYPAAEMGQKIFFSVGGLLISALILTAVFFLGVANQTHDVEILNGQITGKTRVHDSYVRSYSCNCTTTGTGTNARTSCQTCYEDRYTVTWDAQSTIGSFRIDHSDSGSRRVYSKPNPPFYDTIKPGDPAARRNSYTNYIKAAPDSLFSPAAKELREQYASQIPAYPSEMYDLYKVDRVLPVGITVPNLAEWNQKLSLMLRTVGPRNQANAVIVLVNTDDPNYLYALRDAWVNGKKNDVVVVVGASKFPERATWVGVLAFTEREIFQVQLRDAVLALPSLTADGVIGAIENSIEGSYVRRSMEKFEYLATEIDPPLWLTSTTTALIIAAYVGFWYFLRRQCTPRPTYRGLVRPPKFR